MKKKFLFLFFINLLLASCTFKSSSFIPPPIQKLSQVNQINDSTTTEFKKIYLLLPLSGKISGSGNAIRNGFLTAYEESRQHGQNNILITSIDTNGKDTKDLYSQAIAEGAEFIIGPLMKSEVENIATIGVLAVPTLALNTTDKYSRNKIPNLYQFGLSSRDEAVQISQKAWEQNLRQALIIAPDSARGQSLAVTLNDAWQYFGGTIKNTILYTNITNANQKLRETLGINIDKNPSHSAKFQPYSGDDIDVVFLIASPEQGRQINPLIRFYLNPNIPVYSISEIYSGIEKPDLDMDLEGITFCDMPWVSQINNLPESLLSLQNDLKAYPDYKNYSRLYALGIDAYYLMINFKQLSSDSSISFSGATGLLNIDQYQHVYRRLNFSRIINGVPKRIGS